MYTYLRMPVYNNIKSFPLFAIAMARKLFILSALLFLSSSIAAQHKDYYQEGNAYMNQKKFVLAEETFAEGILIDSSLHILYPSLANAMMMQQKHNPADSVLDVILKKHPNYLGALWFKGLNYFYWDRDSMSIIYMKKYLKRAKMPNNQVIKGYYYVGRAYEKILRTKGLNQMELSEMIAYYDKFSILGEGHPAAARVKGFIAAVKAQKPVNYTGRWIFKDPPVKKE